MLATGVNFTAFNCESEASNFSALDIRDVSPCKSPDTDYEDVEVIKASLIQTNVPKTVKVLRCRLKLTKYIKEHGMHSHDFGKIHHEYDEKMMWAHPDLCKNMYAKRQFRCPTNLCGGTPSGLIHFPRDNEEKMWQWETSGTYDGENNAHSVMITTRAGQLVYGVETALLKITVSNHSANLEVSSKVLEIPSLHLRVKYGTGHHFDETAGILAWEAPDISCLERSAIIAKNANASIRRLKPEHRRKGEEHKNVGAILIVEDPKEERATGMVISENKDYCSAGCHETNIESLNVCIGADLDNIDQLEERPANQVTRLNMQSQGSYLAINSNLGLYDLHAKMQTSICELETRAVKQDFASILNVNNPYALEGMRTTDSEKPLDTVFDVLVRGSVAYFSRCSEENVEVLELENCTQQIPVRRANGDLYFVDPINYKMVKFPNIVECVDGLPIQYKINNKRYCHDPRHKRCPMGTEPTMIQPAVGGKARGIKVEDLPSLGDQLVSPRQIQQIKEVKKLHSLNHIVMDQVAHTAATATFAEDNRLGGVINIAMPLSKEDIDRLTSVVAGNMFFLFRWLGQIYLHVFGLMILFNLVKHIFETIYRMYYIYKAFGPGIWILKACGATMFSMSMLPMTILQATAEQAKEKLVEWREELLPPPDYERYQASVEHSKQRMDNIAEAVADLKRKIEPEKDTGDIVGPLYPSHMLHELSLVNQSTPNAPEISVFGPADENGRAPPTNFSTFRSEQGDNATSVVRAIQPQPRQPPVARIFRNPPPTCSGYPYGWKPTAVDRTIHEVSEHPDLATQNLEERKPPDGSERVEDTSDKPGGE